MRYLRPAINTSLLFRLSLVSFLLNLAVETSGVFMPLYAESLGASNLQVGFVAATYAVAYFLSSLFFGRLSDMHGRLVFIRLGLGLSALAYFSQIVAHGPALLLAARGFVGFCLGTTSGALMAYTYDKQKEIGKFLSYGSLGWVVGAFAAAAMRSYVPLFLVSVASSMLAFLMSLTLERETEDIHVKLPSLPLSAMKRNRNVYIALFLRQLGATAIWAIFPLYLTSLGASKSWIAILDAINMGVQFVAMRFVERFNPARAFRTGLLISGVVFVIYGLATNYLQLIPVQILLAIAWSTIFIGAFSYLLRSTSEHGTVSGLLYSTLNLSAGLGPFLGGAIAQVWGFVTLMYVGSSTSFLGFLASAGLRTGKERGSAEQ